MRSGREHLAWMVADEEDEEEKEEEEKEKEKEKEEEEEKSALIKSNNPHLAGGELHQQNSI